MTVFATVADVERVLPWRFSNLSSPTIGMVEDMLRRHSATLVTLLRSKGVDEPDSDENPEAWAHCELYVVYSAIGDILRFRAIETGDNNLAQLAAYYDSLAKDLRDRLEANPQAFMP